MISPLPIEIIGGGLAGLSLGLALRHAGVPVTVFEAGHYPRHRVCGEFITGLSASTITRLGLAPCLANALLHREVAWFTPAPTHDRPASVQTLPSPALGLSRFALDARLAAAFTAAGGILHTKTRYPDPTSAAGRVFTTGRRRHSGGWLGLKIHVRRVSLARDLELHLGDQAYVGLARVEDGAVNVCGLFRRRELCAKGAGLLSGYLHASGLGQLATRFAAAEVDETSFCAVAAVGFDRRTLPLEADRADLGDACAMIPPFTGNGMAMAFQSAESAIGPLLAYAHGAANWAETCQLIHRALHLRFRLRLGTAHVIHPFLLNPFRQRLLGALSRVHLLPLRPLYSALH
jgi:flavin-dependent dehydrogenase